MRRFATTKISWSKVHSTELGVDTFNDEAFCMKDHCNSDIFSLHTFSQCKCFTFEKYRKGYCFYCFGDEAIRPTQTVGGKLRKLVHPVDCINK